MFCWFSIKCFLLKLKDEMHPGIYLPVSKTISHKPSFNSVSLSVKELFLEDNASMAFLNDISWNNLLFYFKKRKVNSKYITSLLNIIFWLINPPHTNFIIGRNAILKKRDLSFIKCLISVQCALASSFQFPPSAKSNELLHARPLLSNSLKNALCS